MKWETDSPCHSHSYTREECRSPGRVAGSWSLGIVKQSQWEGCCWLQRKEWRGCEGGDHDGKCQLRKARKPWKQGNTAESCIEGGAITIASLSPHASIGSWSIENLAQQTPDALNFRVGSHQGAPLSAWCADLQSRTSVRGGPLYVPDMPNNREGPQARDPFKCLNGLSYGERLAKEAFWSPATRGLKKDSDRDTTPAMEVVCAPEHLGPPGSLQAKQLHHFCA